MLVRRWSPFESRANSHRLLVLRRAGQQTVKGVSLRPSKVTTASGAVLIGFREGPGKIFGSWKNTSLRVKDLVKHPSGYCGLERRVCEVL